MFSQASTAQSLKVAHPNRAHRSIDPFFEPPIPPQESVFFQPQTEDEYLEQLCADLEEARIFMLRGERVA